MTVNYLIVPGAQKCGTSSFCALLVECGIALPGPVKEPQFFALQEALVSRWIDWHQKWMSSPPRGGEYILDGSTFYLPSQSTPELLFKHYPQARIIVLVRDPVVRSYSAWLHMVKKLRASERRSFSAILHDIKVTEANGTYEAENKCLVHAAELGKIDLDYAGSGYLRERIGAPFDSIFQDSYIPFRYLGQSLYSRGIERFRSFFGDRMMIVVFEELVSETDKVMNQVADFLNIDLFAHSLVLPHANPTLVPRNKAARYFLKWYDEPVMQRFFRLVPKNIRRAIPRRLFVRPDDLTVKDAEICRELLDIEYCYWLKREPLVRKFWLYA